MFTKETINRIKKTIFNLVEFQFDGEVSVISFDGVMVKYENNKALIGCSSLVTMARGFFLLAKELSSGKKKIDITQRQHFSSCGAMLDMSRGGVMRVEAVKRYLENMAALGLNLFMLYTEDTYEIKEYPFFGYMRGRYTLAELREIDDYAFGLGIEVIPCIQTLGHLAQYLRWPEADTIKDTPSVLMVGEEKTYDFIESAIKTVSNAFRSRKIHLGMDEAHDMGLGKYLKKHGYQNRFDIFNNHLDRVKQICKKYNLEPMIWSDMYFRLGGGESEEYTGNSIIPQEVISKMKGTTLVYWDYYQTDQKVYDSVLKRHLSFGTEVVFAGGIWTWDGLLVNTKYTFDTMKPAMRACLGNNIQTVLATLWATEGCDTDYMQSIYSLALFSEYSYLGLECTDEDINSIASYLTKMDSDFIFALSKFQLDYPGAVMMGRRFICTDILFELLRYPTDYDNAKTQYESALSVIENYKAGKNQKLKHYAELLFSISIEKCEILQNLRKKYLQKDLPYMKKMAEKVLPKLIALHEELANCHEEIWLQHYKAFGLEEIQIRYAGIIARLQYAKKVIAKYINGEITLIEELEHEVLPFSEDTWLPVRAYMNTSK